MLKLYLFYLVFGGYLLTLSIFIWIFSAFNGGDNIVTYLAIFSSAALFLIATGLLFYHSKWAAIIGLIALIGISPFGIHWFWYRYTYEWPLVQGGFNQIMLLATVWYIVSVIFSIRYILNYKSGIAQIALNMPCKLSLAFFPVFLFIVISILCFL